MAKRAKKKTTTKAAESTPKPDAAAPPKSKSKPKTKKPPLPPWPEFARNATETEITGRITVELSKTLQDAQKTFPNTCFVLLLDTGTSISNYELDRIYQTLTKENADKTKNVTLIIQSPGGGIEPAYQISKVCKLFAKDTFRVIVPRYAKSAATLISLGADEIHMGPLSHLGPIDPQIGGLPALGVARALSTIAELSEKHPGSAEMFSKYLNQALTVEQIGYCDRISESAEQYAERLLSTKANLPRKASIIAKELVHEYKDHGFVIDVAEAQQHLGTDWVISDGDWVKFGESVYEYYDMVSLFIRLACRKKLLIAGDPHTTVLIGN